MSKKKNNYLTTEERMKKNFIKGALISGVICVTVSSVSACFVIPMVKKAEHKATIREIKKEGQYITTFFLTEDVVQGQEIEDKMVGSREISSDEVGSDVVGTKEDIVGKCARLSMASNTTVTTSMIVKKDDRVTKDLRTQDYDHIKLNINLEKDMYFDIRYKTPSGDDAVVVSKRKVLETDGGSVITNITEEQRAYLNNATVVASAEEGLLYTTIYVDGENQPPAKVTYVLNEKIKEAIEKDPNILKDAQKDLKAKLADIDNPSDKESGSNKEKPKELE